MMANGCLQPIDENPQDGGVDDTAAAVGTEGCGEKDDTPLRGDQDYESLRAAPVGEVGPSRPLMQQHRNGRWNPSPRAQPGPQRIQVGKGTMFAAQQPAARPIHCYNCGKEGHKRFQCPEPPRSRQEQEAIMEKLKQLYPLPDQRPHVSLILDAELACAARSVDLSTTESAQQALEELGADATHAVQDYLRYLGEPAAPE